MGLAIRLYDLFMIDAGLWTLWAKGRAVDNRFIVIHGKRPGSPRANCPQVHSPGLGHRLDCCANQWCRLVSELVKQAGVEGRYPLSALCEGTDFFRTPPPAPPSVDEESTAQDVRHATADLTASSRRCATTPTIFSLITGGISCKS